MKIPEKLPDALKKPEGWAAAGCAAAGGYVGSSIGIVGFGLAGTGMLPLMLIGGVLGYAVTKKLSKKG